VFLAGLAVFGAAAAAAGAAGAGGGAAVGSARRRGGAALRPAMPASWPPRWRCWPSAWSLAECPRTAAKAYYEILFWGGGHALQFTWTLLMLVGWLWLARPAARACR
jgi:cytochrome c oxidase subunit 1